MNDRAQMPRRSLLAGVAPIVSAIVTFTPGNNGAWPEVQARLVQYQDHPKGVQRCEICVYFQPPNQPRFVAGDISAKVGANFSPHAKRHNDKEE